MTGRDFDAWRAGYDQMSLADHRAFWERLAREHPEQEHTHFEPPLLDLLVPTKPLSVAELGGWRGHLARKALSLRSNILSWTNYDLLDHVSACDDSRYRAVVLDSFPWETGIKANIVVMGHVLEHMKSHHVAGTLDRLDCDAVYVEVPTLLDDWSGVTASHIFSGGILRLVDLVASRFPCLRHGSFPGGYDWIAAKR